MGWSAGSWWRSYGTDGLELGVWHDLGWIDADDPRMFGRDPGMRLIPLPELEEAGRRMREAGSHLNHLRRAAS